MTKRRIAVFMGGPYDGKAMELLNDKNPYILLPYDTVPVRFASADEIMGMDISEPRYGIARYEWTPIAGLPESCVDIFAFAGVDR